VKDKKACPDKRPYSLGKRLLQSDSKRARILAATRAQLESNGFLTLTLEVLARESGVTRQTIYNLYGTKAGVVEALFDQIALDGGMDQMREVIRGTSPETILDAFVTVFTTFWNRHRLLIRRIHGIAAIDLEFGAVVEARNRRRQFAASRVIDRLNASHKFSPELKADHAATLYALTSFEFFDALVEATGSPATASSLVLAAVHRTLAS
jgi:AcrR family transcriptional regulator